MAGSFDSHVVRHNMMWQCQLSQPDCRCYRVDGYSLLKRLPLHPLIGPRCPMQSVGQWLDSIGLVQYENHLLANGFDNVQFMVSVFFLGRGDVGDGSSSYIYRSSWLFCVFALNVIASPCVPPPSKLPPLPHMEILIVSRRFLCSH